jgi:hypothetical protein
MNASNSLRTGFCAVAILMACLPGPAIAESPNAILRTLLAEGVPLTAGQSLKLPEPTLADGMTAAQQPQQVEMIAAGRNSWEDLTRRSVVAPFILRISPDDSQQPEPEQQGTEQKGSGRRVDLWFIAYGSLETLASDDFLKEQFKSADAENASSVQLLSAADLTKRGLPVPSAADDSRYLAAEATSLDRVRVRATTRSIKTRSADSLLVASILDPRFAADPEFSNGWQPILRDDTGSRQLGAVHAYLGLGSYVKATRLVEPEGALLIEYHAAYDEPAEWFDGANLLRSKRPIVAQTVVRKLRRSLAGL